MPGDIGEIGLITIVYKEYYLSSLGGNMYKGIVWYYEFYNMGLIFLHANKMGTAIFVCSFFAESISPGILC